MDVNEFEKDRSIDPTQLDLEATNQPDLFFKWAERAVEARGEVDRAKARMDGLEASLLLRCRKDPDSFGLTKATDASVQAAVRCHDDYTGAQHDYLDARGISNMLDKAVQTMEMKKRMLEAMITLHGQQYFAGPSVPRDLAAAWLAQKEKTDSGLKKRQKVKIRKRGQRRKGSDK